MSIDHRTQHIQANTSYRDLAKPPAASNSAASKSPSPAMSDARLAAEAAFAAPALNRGATIQARVTVRKTRLPACAVEPARAQPGPSAEPAPNHPRVFRVEGAPKASAVGQHETAQRPPEGRPTGVATPGPAKLRHSRPQHIATAKQPGPVTHVVLAAPALHEKSRVQPTPATLLAELSSIGQILDAARRAQSLEIMDRRAGARRQRLLRVAENIRRDIKAHLG